MNKDIFDAAYPIVLDALVKWWPGRTQEQLIPCAENIARRLAYKLPAPVQETQP